MLGKIVVEGDDEAKVDMMDPGKTNLVAEVSIMVNYSVLEVTKLIENKSQ